MLYHYQKYFTAVLTWNLNLVDTIPQAMYFPFAMSWLDKPYIKEVDNLEKKFEVSFYVEQRKN